MTPDTKNLHEYLRDVLDIESNLYVLQKLSEELHLKLSNIQLLKVPEKPSVPETPKSENKGTRLPPFITVLIGIAGIILVGFLRREAHLHGFSAFLFSVLLGSIPLTFIIGGILGFADNAKSKSETETAVQKYEQDKRKYADKLSAYQDMVLTTAAVNIKRQAEQAIIQANIDAVEKQFSSSLLMLDNLYSANVIHPKYRNLSAVSSLYEYIDTGRCFQLEGPSGAYNLFENEVRLDRILLKMDEVIEKLDSIRQSQYQLYAAVTEGNSRTEALLESVARDVEHVSASEHKTAKQLADIAANEKIIAYNTERARKELEYYNRMRYRLGDYNKVWDNYRP